VSRKWKVPKETINLITDIAVENWLDENWANFCRTERIQNTPENRKKAKSVIYPPNYLSDNILKSVEDFLETWKLGMAFDEELSEYSERWEEICSNIRNRGYDKAYVNLHYLIPKLREMIEKRGISSKYELWPEGPSLSEVYQGLVYVCGELDYHMENLLAIADRLVLDGHGPREDYSYTALSMFLQHIDQEHGGEIYGHR